MRKRKIVVTESELINSIEKIVKEQAAMLGFGNMNGLSLGVAKPTDKYQEMYEDDNTYNVNYMNQGQANQNMEDWEMGEDYDMEEDIADLVRDELLEQIHGFNCEPSSNGCNCVTNSFGTGQYQSIQDCENSENCCSGDVTPGKAHKGSRGQLLNPGFQHLEPNTLGGAGGAGKVTGIGPSSWGQPDIRDPYKIHEIVRRELKEIQAKEAKKWIQGAVKRPGALRKKLGVKKGDKISLEKINQEMRKLKSKDTNKAVPGVQGLTKADLRTYKQLNLAKTLRGMSKKKHAKESRKWVKK